MCWSFVTQTLGRSFKESLKSLGADIQHANTLASEFPCEYDGACLQMRLSYSPTARYFHFLLQWTGCSLAGALGLLRILIYKAYLDGTTTMYRRERKATLQEFYAFIYPSLQQFQRLTTTEVIKQRTLCSERYKRKADDTRVQLPDSDFERDQECGICMENNSKIVLPDCNHAMCMKCYRDWRVKSQSCPFCRETLKRVKSSDLWVFVESGEVQDMGSLERDNARRLFMFIDKLPLLVVDKAFAVQDSHIK